MARGKEEGAQVVLGCVASPRTCGCDTSQSQRRHGQRAGSDVEKKASAARDASRASEGSVRRRKR
jgi:hypothetical protein